MNIVQYGGVKMNTIKTSKEKLLEASSKAAMENGLKSINIRSLAQSCGVSVGSVYNYFPSKADLIAETVGAIWEQIFDMTKQCERPKGFLNNVAWLFDCLKKGSSEYSNFFTLHSESFTANEKETGRTVMNRYMEHIKHGLLQEFSEDYDICKNTFSDTFTPEQLIDFIFSNLLMIAAKGEENCNILLEVVKRAIYKNN